MTDTVWSTVDSRFGPFGAVVDASGAVLASGWTTELTELLDVIAPEMRPRAPRRVSDLGPVTRAVARYDAGELDAIDDVPVRQSSGPFLQHAWSVLRTIPPGRPVSYTGFAELAGRPAAVRAAGSACARNAAALFVPCHRVLRTDRSLGGFRWGTGTKQRLLDHEADHLER